jgi:hypothetical protein
MGIPATQVAKRFGYTANAICRYRDGLPQQLKAAIIAATLNGSRVISLPGSEKTVRGLASVDLIIVDEAARVDDDLLAATRPMLAVSKQFVRADHTGWQAWLVLRTMAARRRLAAHQY